MTNHAFTRIESDAFGPVEILADRYWGAQTQRALGLFEVGSERFPPRFLRAFGLQKAAAARANHRCGILDDAIVSAIVRAADELSAGRLDDHFPLTIWQTGSGTQTNMNVNEVIANCANVLLGHPLGSRCPVHPNDHVNASQSSNDSFPTVMHMAVAMELRESTMPSLKVLEAALSNRALAFKGIVKIARTHLMDAVPMTMGQTFTTFARQVALASERLLETLPRLLTLPQGGTAVGTGLNAPAGFDIAFCEEARLLTGLAFVANPNKFEGMGSHDALVDVSAALSTIATSFLKIANDIRWLGSGPNCGLGELVIPDDRLTSSSMPGKRNATIAEVLVQTAFQVIGNHTTITIANASGNFELNVAKPVIAYNLLQSLNVLADATRLFASKLIDHLEVDPVRLADNVSSALLVVTRLNGKLGYDLVARITTASLENHITPRDAAIQLGLLTGEEYDRLIDPAEMALEL